jgi:hypothetical protein
MLSSTTPFKIHDENAGVPMSRKKALNSVVKGQGVGGLEGGPTKTPKVPKSSRKALGSISVNIKGQNVDMSANVGKAPSVLQFPAPATGSKTATKHKCPEVKADVSNMICSHVEKEEDAYDLTMRNASNINTVIVPGANDVQDSVREEDVNAWQESPQDVDSCAALSMGHDRDQGYTFSTSCEEYW